MPRYRALLFDLDGTLLDTLHDLAQSMNAVLRRRGLPQHAPAAYRYFVGDGIAELARRVLPEAERSADTVAAVVAEMRAEYALHYADATGPYPGVAELLAGLAARGFTLAVFSNKPDDFVQATVAQFLPRERFAAVLGIRPGVPPKPDPYGALFLAQTLAIPPAAWLYLGDTATDMRTAHAAGMRPLGALWGFREAAELRAAGAHALLERPLQLLEFVDALPESDR